MGFYDTVCVDESVWTPEMEYLETAISIKNRKKRITYIYDTACRLIDEYNREHGIVCEFVDNRCMDCHHNSHINGCCYHCPYQSSSGCPTSNLSCKLYFCNYMKERYTSLMMGDIAVLRLLSKSQKAILRENVFATRETSINLLWIGSYLVFGLFSIVKIMRMRNLKLQRKEK